MNFPFRIAARYLFARKSHTAVNVVTAVSACGVAVVTAALVCALSVLNGFHDLTAKMFGQLDPTLRVTPAKGKTLAFNDGNLYRLWEISGIAGICGVLQDNALIRYGDRQVIGVVKGVEPAFRWMSGINNVLIDGDFLLREDVTDYATLGIGMAYSLGVRPGFTEPLSLYAPKRNERLNLANPLSSFHTEYAYVGGVFSINQQAYDDSYVIVPIDLARSLFHYKEATWSALELALQPSESVTTLKENIQSILGSAYKVEDRYEQQSDAFKMMQVEKLMIFFILSFILFVALFNVIGTLSLLMIEKEADSRTLRNLGADAASVRSIFLIEGWMIAGLGALTGLVAGLLLCGAQQMFGLIRLGGEAGHFIVDTYPVKVELLDLAGILATVLLVGFMSSLYAVFLRARKKGSSLAESLFQ
ncbi:MAG: ABC transporter permease [Tannerellaceae bacterium]|jgi:ABC-type lipoprotein release transport system permease subunit|nr:ABC transporter permease [Tannerellaceae bacterium]